MKTFYFSFLIASLLAFTAEPVRAQDLNTIYGEYNKAEKERLKQIKAKHKDYTAFYAGKKVYLIKPAGDDKQYIAHAPEGRYLNMDANPGHTLYMVSDTNVVVRSLRSYFCTEVITVKDRFAYDLGRPDNCLALNLFDGYKDYKVIVYPLSQPGGGYDDAYRDVPVTLKTGLGVFSGTIPCMVTDVELDSLKTVLQMQYSAKLAIKRQMEAAAAEQAEQERLAREQERLAQEQLRREKEAKAEQERLAQEQLRREQEAKALEAQREARARAIAAEEAEQARKNARLTDLKNHYGEQFGKLVFVHKIAVGMNKEAVRESLGEPVKVTVTEKDTSYEYKDRIVIFDGKTGVVSSIVNLK